MSTKIDILEAKLAEDDIYRLLKTIEEKLGAITAGQVENAVLAAATSTPKITTLDQSFDNYVERYEQYYKPYTRHAVNHAGFTLLYLGTIFYSLATFENRMVAFPITSLFLLLYAGTTILCGHAPFESTGRFFVPKKTAKQIALTNLFYKASMQAEHLGMSLRSELTYLERNMYLKALFCIKNAGGFDCVALTGCAILALLSAKAPLQIQRIRTTDYAPGRWGHSFVVINLKSTSTLRDINTWNDDALIFDLWYRVIINARSIKKNVVNFFIQYPLLELSNKGVAETIMGNTEDPNYRFFVEKFEKLIAQENSRRCKPLEAITGVLLPMRL